MVIVKISTRGVESVGFESPRGALHDPTVSLWPLLEKELGRLDRAVRRANARVVGAVVGRGAIPSGETPRAPA